MKLIIDEKEVLDLHNENSTNYTGDTIITNIDNGKQFNFYDRGGYIKVPKDLWIVINNIKIYKYDGHQLSFTTDDIKFIELYEYLNKQFRIENELTKSVHTNRNGNERFTLYKMYLELPCQVNKFDVVSLGLKIFKICRVYGLLRSSEEKCRYKFVCKHIKVIKKHVDKDSCIDFDNVFTCD